METNTVSKPKYDFSKESVFNCLKLVTSKGRQFWEFNVPSSVEDKDYLEQLSEAFIYDKKQNPNSGDKIFRALISKEKFHPIAENEIPVPDDLKNDLQREVFKANYKAIHYFQSLQTNDGNWVGDYGGPMFLTPGLVIANYVTETPLPAIQHELIKRYMLNHQNDDGGWGLHLEGDSTMFGTVCNMWHCVF
jgi:hypothetical protein